MTDNKKTIILFALPDFRGGGAERVFLNLINNISKDIFTVHVAVGKFQGEYCDNLSDDIEVHVLGNTSFLFSLLPLIRLIWKIRPNVVLSTLGYVVSASFASIFCSKKIFFISRLGNTLSSFLDEQNQINKIRYYLQYLINKSVVYFSNLIIVQSNHMRDDLIKTLSIKSKLYKKIIQINNPVDFASLKLNKYSHEITEDLNDIFVNNFVFISVGRLENRKNYQNLIRSFKKVVDIYPHTRLIILGDGDNRSKLEKIIVDLDIQNHVSLPGFLNNTEVLVSKSDFFISASLYEGVSNAILESLALGVPVIATDCPSGISEIIKNGDNGYLVSLEGSLINKLSESMMMTVKENKKFELSKTSKPILESFDIKIVIKEYEEILINHLKKL
jgi:glycosyltransferase involved in cell wall biosynthesis